jgi:hypothetical protein
MICTITHRFGDLHYFFYSCNNKSIIKCLISLIVKLVQDQDSACTVLKKACWTFPLSSKCEKEHLSHKRGPGWESPQASINQAAGLSQAVSKIRTVEGGLKECHIYGFFVVFASTSPSPLYMSLRMGNGDVSTVRCYMQYSGGSFRWNFKSANLTQRSSRPASLHWQESVNPIAWAGRYAIWLLILNWAGLAE